MILNERYYSKKYIQSRIDFFAKDFFGGKFNTDIDIVFVDDDTNMGYTLPETDIHKIYINRVLLYNKKPLDEVILHEMMHIYDYTHGDAKNVRIYRKGHGRFFMELAKEANVKYGMSIGAYCSFDCNALIKKYKENSLRKELKSHNISSGFLVITFTGRAYMLQSLNVDQLLKLIQENETISRIGYVESLPNFNYKYIKFGDLYKNTFIGLSKYAQDKSINWGKYINKSNIIYSDISGKLYYNNIEKYLE